MPIIIKVSLNSSDGRALEAKGNNYDELTRCLN